MSEKKYLLRKATGDLSAETEQEVRDWFQKGQCKPADALFDFSANAWVRVGDLAGLADLLGPKPGKNPEKRLIYFMSAGALPALAGPFTTKEIQQKMQGKELCEASWVFVEGDKEWRQVRTIKVLLDMLPALPTDIPAAPAAEEAPLDLSAGEILGLGEPSAPPSFGLGAGDQSNPSIRLDLGGGDASDGPPPMEAPASADYPEREDPTMAISALGLSSLKVDHTKPVEETPAPAAPPPKAPLPGLPPSAKSAAPPAAPPKPVTPPLAPLPAGASPQAATEGADQGSFDGITAEISVDPIWLIKKANSEAVSGPFRFLDVMKFLEEGRINKADKISKVGTNRFVKIQQQYEFNVRYAVETVVEHGVEKQKILIKRRHPRVPYFTGVQILTKGGLIAANCVNISAGGILMEIAKADFNLGDILEVKIMPGLINRSISCKSLVIGKIPKIPPAFALKFEDLKNEDKEAIEFYVQETLKREMSKNG